MPELEVATFGEALVVMQPAHTGPLSAVHEFRRGVGGAEVNVAVGLARLGHEVAWVGCVGDDPLGHEVLGALRAEGVDVRGARMDPDGFTGLYVKELPAGGGARAHYFRDGSAASRFTPDRCDIETLLDAQIVHLTGISVLLSADGRDVARETLERAVEADRIVSFDVNFRAALRCFADPHRTLAPFVERCDVLFLSGEESRAFFGTDDPRRIGAASAGCRAQEIVVHDHHGAFAWTPDGVVEVPAQPTVVRDPVGAGDAFAAGYLSARLRGAGLEQRLRLGTFCASRVVSVAGDHAGAPTRAEAVAG